MPSRKPWLAHHNVENHCSISAGVCCTVTSTHPTLKNNVSGGTFRLFLVHVLISFTFNRIGLLYHASFLHAHDCPPCRITPSLLCAILLQPIQHLHRPPTEPPHRAAHRTLPETARRFHMHLQPIQHLHRPPTQPPHRAGYRALPETARRFHMHLQHKRASTVTCQLLLKRRSGPRGTINRAIRHNAR